MSILPEPFSGWLARRGWELHPHQRQMLMRAGEKALLLVAPTGGGKTLAGFLPSLLELAAGARDGLHTLYVSPLKALAADIRRNLSVPVAEMGLAVRIEDRTGDTPYGRKRAQRVDPPHILLTTPESLALLLSYPEAPQLFGTLSRVIVDEAHALAESKRGDQLVLALARLERLAPGLRRVALSATVEEPRALAQWLAPEGLPCAVLEADPGPAPDIAMLETALPPPWAGGGGRHAIPEILDAIRRHRTTLIFHNTRAQAEIFFHHLWLANDDDLPIAIHHGSMAREARARVEAAMVEGKLRAVVCTGTLDLGIDWGDVDLVVQVGAPKNVKRLVQRIGRANHRYNAPSKALVVPANRFEVVECVAALEAVRARALDGAPRGNGPRDVLCQHILITAAAGPFDADALYEEVRGAGGYRDLSRADFDACLDFVATGGYALRAYDRWQRLKRRPDGLWELRDPRTAARIRMNIGTIQDNDMVKVRLRGRGRALGEVEEAFAATLTPGDTFLIGGRVVRHEAMREMTVEVSPTAAKQPKVAVYSGTKFATSTQLMDRILAILAREHWPELPSHTAEWLALQRQVSRMPARGEILVETFAHDGRPHACVWGFAGRNAMQTLGLLLTRRMETTGLGPLGFVASDYAVMIWSVDPVTEPAPLFDARGLRAEFEDWLQGNAVMKRTFRSSAIIAGLIERNAPSGRRSARQAAFSSDIIYDTLRRFEPDHVLMRITREEAMKGLVDFGRIEEMLMRTGGRIVHVARERVPPLAAPLLLEAGRVPIDGAGAERLLAAEAERLMQAAGLADIGAGAS